MCTNQVSVCFLLYVAALLHFLPALTRPARPAAIAVRALLTTADHSCSALPSATMGSYEPFPASPPISPPNGFQGTDGFSTPLFPPRPNILFIMADQLAAPLLKMHNPQSQIKTPNLDQLAERSVVFDAAYCNSPLCAPSRMCLISGQLPSKIGSYDNACTIPSETPTYAHYLRAAGYETTLAGKMHFIGDQLHGYENRLTADIYPGDYGWAVNWDEPDRRLEWYHNSSSIVQAGPCVRTNQLDYDEEVLYKSKQYLYDYAREPAAKRPFALTVSFTHPHDPYAIEHKYWDLYEDVDIELPKVSITPEDQDPHSKRLLHVCELEGHDFTAEQIRRARRAYYGAVSYVDDCIGQLLEVLKKCGLEQDTISKWDMIARPSRRVKYSPILEMLSDAVLPQFCFPVITAIC